MTKWDNRSLVRLGLLIYAAANLSSFLLIRRQTASPRLRCAAALFLVLPGMYENLVWAWQTQFHLCLLFGVMALWSLQLTATAGRRAAKPATTRANHRVVEAVLVLRAAPTVPGAPQWREPRPR